MPEGSPGESEGHESIPTKEYVRLVFEALVGQEVAYETTKLVEDEKGVYKWEITVPTKEGHIEYLYLRETLRPKGKGNVLEPHIHVVFYDQTGMPISGGSIAEYRDGKWLLIS